MGKKRWNRLLIKPDYEEQEALKHEDMPINRNALLSCNSKSEYDIFTHSRRGITFTSTDKSSKRLCLKNSRINRLTRFRTTAFPIFLLAVTPKRAVWLQFSRHTTRKPVTVVLCCAEASWINSDRFRTRTVFGNVATLATISQECKLFSCNSYGQNFTPFCSSALDD